VYTSQTYPLCPARSKTDARPTRTSVGTTTADPSPVRARHPVSWVRVVGGPTTRTTGIARPEWWKACAGSRPPVRPAPRRPLPPHRGRPRGAPAHRSYAGRSRGAVQPPWGAPGPTLRRGSGAPRSPGAGVGPVGVGASAPHASIPATPGGVASAAP